MMRARTEAQTLALYEKAINRVPPLSRVVYLLHRVEELPYGEIAGRLSITVPVVEACMIEALLVICARVDGKAYRPRPHETIADAEAALRQRHRLDCSDGLRGLIQLATLRTPTFEQWLWSMVKHNKDRTTQPTR